MTYKLNVEVLAHLLLKIPALLFTLLSLALPLSLSLSLSLPLIKQHYKADF
jgi:hypothetical protein